MNPHFAYEVNFKRFSTLGKYRVLEVLPYDLWAFSWGCMGVSVGAVYDAMWKGLKNTELIQLNCSESGKAADVCTALTYGGKHDWYLPSVDEMQAVRLAADYAGSFSLFYWTSTEIDADQARCIRISDGGLLAHNKLQLETNPFPIRPVRQYYTDIPVQVGRIGQAGVVVNYEEINPAEWQIRIYDTETEQTGAVPVELYGTGNGFDLKYDAGISDVIHPSLIKSECTFSITQKNSSYTNLLTQLVDSKDSRFVVELRKDDVAEWRGILLNDFSSIADAKYQGMSFTAVDGLGMLQNFKPTDAPFASSAIGMLGWILDGLNKIQSSLLFEITDEEDALIDEKFCYVKTAYEATGYPTQFLDMLTTDVAINEDAPTNLWGTRTVKEAYNGQQIIVKDFKNYYDIIEHILSRFNVVIMMRKGRWYITHRKLMTEDTTLSWNVFRKQSDGVSAETWKIGNEDEELEVKIIDQTSYRYRSAGEFLYVPPVHSVKVLFAAGNVAGGFDSLLPNGFKVGQEYTTFPLPQGTNNYLEISLSFSEEYLANDPVDPTEPDWKGHVTYGVRIRQGAYYYTAFGWTTTPGLLYFDSTVIEHYEYLVWHYPPFPTPPYQQSQYPPITINRAYINVSLMTPPLPEDDVPLVFEIVDREVVMAFGVAPTVNPVEFDWDNENHFVRLIVDNESAVTAVTFEAEADNDTEIIYEVEDSLFGSTGNTAAGTNVIRPAGQVWKSGDDDTEYYFNELLVNEILKQNSKYMLVFSGEIHDRHSEVELIDPIHAIQIEYRSNNYVCFPNNVSFNPILNKWSGDWVEYAHNPRLLMIPHTGVEEAPPETDVRDNDYPTHVRRPVAQVVGFEKKNRDVFAPQTPDEIYIYYNKDTDALEVVRQDDIRYLRTAVGVTLNNEIIGGTKYYIETSDTLDIPENYVYLTTYLTADGLIENDGIIEIID